MKPDLMPLMHAGVSLHAAVSSAIAIVAVNSMLGSKFSEQEKEKSRADLEKVLSVAHEALREFEEACRGT